MRNQLINNFDLPFISTFLSTALSPHLRLWPYRTPVPTKKTPLRPTL